LENKASLPAPRSAYRVAISCAAADNQPKKVPVLTYHFFLAFFFRPFDFRNKSRWLLFSYFSRLQSLAKRGDTPKAFFFR